MDDEGEEEDGDSPSTPSKVDDDQEDEKSSKRPKFRKNPNVDTSFLPDRDREEDDRRERERLRQEWLKRQEDMKLEEIEVIYSFWDGSGHRKSVTVSFFLQILRPHLTIRLYAVI